MAGRILLTGASGQVGGAALPLLQELGEVVAPARGELDLSDAGAVRRAVRAVRPQWIVNCAAYTAVDKAESEPQTAFAVNAEAVGVLGEEAKALGAAVISFSTDYVFPGSGDRPWVESDATAPLNVYGASKLAGEQALAVSGAAHLVFRTSWVYGATGNNFLKTILRLAGEREELTVVADQHGAPTWSEDLARLVAHCISRLPTVEAVRAAGGVYHACAAGETTWSGFAGEIVRLAQAAEPGKRFARVVAVPSSAYPTAAKRPLNSRMNCERLRRELGFVMPEWRGPVAAVLSQLGQRIPNSGNKNHAK